ncbi:MAG: sulfatase-like hydrolase/transferase [Planctomycetota bacterium]|nr:sulfatase-like hydrolase/transferase [Planctomycetota bacterium]MDG1984939.1 sulfatase-like hydrolase/transferase [Planctomycetota bacterium]
MRPATDGAATPGAPRPNVLVLVLDDIGMDAVSCYPDAAPDARTPTLDSLAARGVRFDRVWSNPACSPTRATVLTGRYGFRTGVGSVKALGHGGLRPEETTLAESLHAAVPGLRTAFLGKWHLGPNEEQGPVAQGFERFRGTSGNLRVKARPRPYFEFDERQGRSTETSPRTAYATSAVVDDALGAIQEFGDDPWFVLASFHAAHTPFHVPPEGLHTRALSGPPESSSRAHFMAMVDALDAEIGRLLAGIPAPTRARTQVIVLSDNGTASKAQFKDRPVRLGKGSLFEDGIRVPMIVAGSAVESPGRASSALVNTTDLFATVHELMGVAPAEEAVDSLSFAGALRGAAELDRQWAFAERFQSATNPRRWAAVDRYTVRDGRYKLTVDVLGDSIRLHDLTEDPMERVNLLKAAEISPEVAGARKALQAIVEGTLNRRAAIAQREAKTPSGEARAAGDATPDPADEGDR